MERIFEMVPNQARKMWSYFIYMIAFNGTVDNLHLHFDTSFLKRHVFYPHWTTYTLHRCRSLCIKNADVITKEIYPKPSGGSARAEK